MDFTFRQAKRSNAKPLIGIYAQSGAGKTKSALLLARGFVGPNGRIGMIETEAGRGEIFQGEPGVGSYEVLSLRDDFSPENFGKAISAAERHKLDALIIDSASHEWESTGGVLDMADKNPGRGVLKWQKPKMDHTKHFMLKLLATPIPLVIVCMRAKYPMEQRPDPKKNGEMEWVRSTQLEPKQSDDILFEMLTHFWIDHEHKIHVTRYARDDMKPVLPEGSIITNQTGERLAAWARGEQVDQNPPADRNSATGGASRTAPDVDQRREDTPQTDWITYANRQLARCTELDHVQKVAEKISNGIGHGADPELQHALTALVERRRVELAPKDAERADSPGPRSDEPPPPQSAEPEWDDD